jgi:hypothetical protein
MPHFHAFNVSLLAAPYLPMRCVIKLTCLTTDFVTKLLSKSVKQVK